MNTKTEWFNALTKDLKPTTYAATKKHLLSTLVFLDGKKEDMGHVDTALENIYDSRVATFNNAHNIESCEVVISSESWDAPGGDHLCPIKTPDKTKIIEDGNVHFDFDFVGKQPETCEYPNITFIINFKSGDIVMYSFYGDEILHLDLPPASVNSEIRNALWNESRDVIMADHPTIIKYAGDVNKY